MEQRRIAIVGGGAAGLAAAIAAARAGARVVVLEARDRAGRSILATGNGRCNLTNVDLTAGDYNAPDFVAPVLAAHGPGDIRMFFGRIGLLTKVEGEGRVYPLSNTASSVLDVLRYECARLGVELRCGCRVDRIATASSGRERFELACSEDEDLASLGAEAVVVACGGGVDLLSDLGHVRVPFRPALCSLATDTGALRGLDGVRARVDVSVYAAGSRLPRATERGELLFRKYGVSGIVVFDLSRSVRQGEELAIDFMPHMSADALGDWLSGTMGQMCQTASERDGRLPTYGELLAGTFHPRVAQAVTRAAGLSVDDVAEELQVPMLVHACKDFRLRVEGPGDARHAQITCGGAALEGFDPGTLESRLHPGLHAAGETLDVDGPCGGYNLHWAWASGLVAGANAAR